MLAGLAPAGMAASFAARSNSEVGPLERHVRSTPNSRRRRTTAPCPGCAMTRHRASREGRTEVGKHRVRRKCCAWHQWRSAGMHTDWFDSRTAACVVFLQLSVARIWDTLGEARCVLSLQLRAKVTQWPVPLTMSPGRRAYLTPAATGRSNPTPGGRWGCPFHPSAISRQFHGWHER